MTSVHLAMLRIAGLLVPGEQRAEWIAEWRSELWYAWQSCSGSNSDVTAFCLGAFNDALWLRRNSPRHKVRDILCLDSPSRCLLLLAGFGAISLLIVFLFANPRNVHRGSLPLIIGFAWLIVPATTSLSLGDYPKHKNAPSLEARLRRWIFLAAKIALILPLVYSGLLLVTYVHEATPIEGYASFLIQAVLWGSVSAFRWVLRDQRKRCPLCLRLLTNPVRIGQRAGHFLEWNCTELICPRGHGFLYVPENPTSWFNVQRWLYLVP